MLDMNKYSIISFDLFDTLIKRNVRSPKDIFQIVENKMFDKYEIRTFSKDRVNAEHNLYKKKVYEEISLDEIYDNFPIYYDKKMLEDYKKIEIETELEMCVFNENIRDIYESAIKNKQVIIITDIYLPKSLIVKILKKNSIRYDYLYVSSELRLKKKSGNLFKYVLEELKVSPNKILHIGDNDHSDYKMPKSLGMSAYKIETIVNNSFYNDIYSKKSSFEYNQLSSFINNRIVKIDDYYEKIGYETLGPLLFGFSKWLYSKVENNIDQILFLSRDGQILRRAFEIYDHQKLIKTSYLYASRRALTIPNLNECQTIREMFNFFTFPKYISMKNIIKKFGLSCDDTSIRALIEKMDIEINDKFEFKGYDYISEKNKKFLDKIYKQIIENSNSEFIQEQKYLKNNISTKYKNIAIVDIGWYGNMQTNLEKSLKKIGNFDIYGFYLGLVPQYSNINNLNMTGYMFNTDDRDFEQYIREKNFNSLFELLFSADHGTVIKYNEKNPVLAEYEYSDEQLAKIKKIQAGAIKFVEDISNDNFFKNINYSKEDIIKNIYDLGNNPRYIDVLEIGDFYFLDNEISKISNYNGRYLFNLKKLINDFKKSQWKIAFLKRVFKLNLPYEKICRILRGNKIR